MNKINFKAIKHILFWGGLGFSFSSILSLDGFRDAIAVNQLIVGIVAMLVGVILHIIFKKIELIQ